MKKFSSLFRAPALSCVSLLFTLHFLLLTFNSNAQGLTKYGEITTIGANYIGKNGGIGGSLGSDKNGKQVTAITGVAIGDAYQGGKVAYILVSGDPGYDANTQHGLIAATSDQTNSDGIRWYNGKFVTCATETTIGTGSANTTAIISSQGAIATSYAAGLARAYESGGYTDWYLPSIEELSKLYSNLSIVGNFNIYKNYWSSSQDIANSAWIKNFNDGFESTSSTPGYSVVRAVRAF